MGVDVAAVGVGSGISEEEEGAGGGVDAGGAEYHPGPTVVGAREVVELHQEVGVEARVESEEAA